MLEILLATNNAKKAEELRALLSDLPVTVRSAQDLDDPPRPVEDGNTFVANARIKAVGFGHVATGSHVLADDSGLEVDALEGRPGVYSSRFAGRDGDDEANNRKLLEELRGVPEASRTARFRCVLCLRSPDGDETLAEGVLEGRIADAPRGGAGFGYDPLFLIPSEGRTLAELGASFKQQNSHRARALAQMKEEIRSLVR